ncbi:PDDEXK nuclease domain-containing protein [Spirosoma areae]
MGVLLCADKNDTVVRYTLPENNTQLFASKYQFHLPIEQQLVDEIRKELTDDPLTGHPEAYGLRLLGPIFAQFSPIFTQFSRGHLLGYDQPWLALIYEPMSL